MVKGKKKATKDYEAWLLNFERAAGRPVVVILAIQQGEVEFISCNNKERYLDEPDDDEPDTPDKPLEVERKNIRSSLETNFYIG